MIHREAFLEIQPDRGTDLILEPPEKVEPLFRTHDATLHYVDFWAAQDWRSHGFLRGWIARTSIDTEAVPPETVPIDGKDFDPQAHFADWRERQYEWAASKTARAKARYREASQLCDEGLRFAAVAQRLNPDGMPNRTGRPWTADNLRKFTARMKGEG